MIGCFFSSRASVVEQGWLGDLGAEKCFICRSSKGDHLNAKSRETVNHKRWNMFFQQDLSWTKIFARFASWDGLKSDKTKKPNSLQSQLLWNTAFLSFTPLSIRAFNNRSYGSSNLTKKQVETEPCKFNHSIICTLVNMNISWVLNRSETNPEILVSQDEAFKC